jgi:hypothetical protein
MPQKAGIVRALPPRNSGVARCRLFVADTARRSAGFSHAQDNREPARAADEGAVFSSGKRRAASPATAL